MFTVILKSERDAIQPKVFNVFDVCEKEMGYEIVKMFLMFKNNEWTYEFASKYIPEYCGRG